MRTVLKTATAALVAMLGVTEVHALEVKDVSNTLSYVMNGSTRVAEINFSYSWRVTCLIGASYGSSSTTYNSRQEAISVALSRCKPN